MSSVHSVIQIQNLSKNYGNLQALTSLNLNDPPTRLLVFWVLMEPAKAPPSNCY
jgi:hypothetical protein